MPPLNLDSHELLYRAMAGVGGIGSGMFFAVNHNHTLGREESRSGHLLDRRDYCKLHIVSHYVKALLGPAFAAYPIGRVGADDPGRRLVEEMTAAGLEMSYVEISPQQPTLFSFCFQYPDGSGGNLTTDDSASEYLTPEGVAAAEPLFRAFQGAGVALAVPEVPLATREKLLELGTRYHFLRVASFATAEIEPAIQRGLLEKINLLALNLEEAAAAVPVVPDRAEPQRAVRQAVDRLLSFNPQLRISLTAGRQGSWAWDGQHLVHQPAFQTTVVATAGAGDAHLAGVIAGLAAGLSFREAHELSGLVAGLSVQSPHTIHPDLDRDSLREFAGRQTLQVSASVWELLKAAHSSF